MSRCRSAARGVEDALAEIGSADRLAGENPEVQRAFADLLLKSGQAGAAVERYREAIALAESWSHCVRWLHVITTFAPPTGDRSENDTRPRTVRSPMPSR